MNQFPLTDMQRKTLEVIRSLTAAADGKAPTFAEIGLKLGLNGKGRVATLVKALEERGHIMRMPNRARSIAIIESVAPAAGYTLPPELQLQLMDYCRRAGCEPQAVVEDAVVIFLDGAEGDLKKRRQLEDEADRAAAGAS